MVRELGRNGSIPTDTGVGCANTRIKRIRGLVLLNGLAQLTVQCLPVFLAHAAYPMMSVRAASNMFTWFRVQLLPMRPIRHALPA